MPIDMTDYLFAILKPGMYIEDCNYHPCVVVEVHNEPGKPDYGQIMSLSLINPQMRGHQSREFKGEWNSNCSAWWCGVRLLSEDEAVEWVVSGPNDVPDSERFSWWDEVSRDLHLRMEAPDVFAKHRKVKRYGKCWKFPAKANRNAKRKPAKSAPEMITEYGQRLRERRAKGK